MLVMQLLPLFFWRRNANLRTKNDAMGESGSAHVVVEEGAEGEAEEDLVAVAGEAGVVEPRELPREERRHERPRCGRSGVGRRDEGDGGAALADREHGEVRREVLREQRGAARREADEAQRREVREAQGRAPRLAHGRARVAGDKGREQPHGRAHARCPRAQHHHRPPAQQRVHQVLRKRALSQKLSQRNRYPFFVFSISIVFTIFTTVITTIIAAALFHHTSAPQIVGCSECHVIIVFVFIFFVSLPFFISSSTTNIFLFFGTIWNHTSNISFLLFLVRHFF